MGWQLRFSLYSGAVITKALAVVVSLYYPLAYGSVEYPMPYASCLGCCGVLLCCVSLSSCVLLKGALLVPALLQLSLSCDLGCSALLQLSLPKVLGFCRLFYLVPFCKAPWDSLSELMHSGIACLASQGPDLAVAVWDGLSGLWLVDLWLVPTQVCLSVVSLVVIGYHCNCLDGQLNYQAFTHWLISRATNYRLCNQ